MQLDANRRLVLTPDVWANIQEVQRLGNKIKWTSDEDTWGVKERWTFPKEVGNSKFEDCDGITLWKMHELMKRGFPADPLLFTVCHTETGGGHAILCVTTDRGDYILDNRFSGVKSYDDVRRHGYKILFRSSVGGSLNHLWERINER